MSNKDLLTKEEVESARTNGFILAGKTGAGKTTLLNASFGKEKGLAMRSAKRVTFESAVYFYKLENGKCIAIIDTPGLSDTEKIENGEIDDIHLRQITQVVRENKIHIKGILFLVNFQSERFDADEQNALLKYNELFPLKRFWKNMVIIFTHHFSDPNGEDKEEMQKNRDESNGEIFTKLMKKVEKVSDVITYKQLRIKYFNSYSPLKKGKEEMQKKQNTKVRDELEIVLNELILTEPLFTQVEIADCKNVIYKDEKGNEFIAHVQIIGKFDLNDIALKKDVRIIDKKPISKNIDKKNLPKPEIKVNVVTGAQNSEGQLSHKVSEGTEKNSKMLGTKVGGGIGVFGGILAGGALVAGGLAALPALGIGAGVAAIGALIGSIFN